MSLPETSNVITTLATEASEIIPGPTTSRLSALARRHELWLHSGSQWEKNPGGRPWNTTVLFNPDGEIVAKYRKLHLFDVVVSQNLTVNESDITSPGEEIVLARTSLGRLGLAICYDLRFPELFRLLALAGADVIFVPANFTAATGRAHWESLLRARAIENGCYILAAAQCGLKPQYQAHGHSLILNPWGEIIAGAQDQEELITADINLEEVAQARQKIPNLANRREDIYNLKASKPITGKLI